MLFTAPAVIDATPLNAIACPATTLCVASDRAGMVLWSSAPTRGPGTWRVAHVDGANTITALSCPSVSLCVAVDGAGNVISSSDPSGGAQAWSVARVDTAHTANNTDNGGAVLMRGIACPSTTLCVAVDAAGDAWTSTDPAGGAGAWTAAHIDTASTYACTPTTGPDAALGCQPPLVGVACPSISECVAVDFSGNIFTTSDPQAPTWASTTAPGNGFHSLWGIACPTTGFCDTVDGRGGHAVAFDPLDPAPQTVSRLADPATAVWCASVRLCLAAAETPDGVSVTLGSAAPTASVPGWEPSPLGDLNAVACPTPVLCLAADDGGHITTGLSTASARIALDLSFFRARRLPTVPQLARAPRERFITLAPIPAQVGLTWTIAVARRPPIIIASLRHRFTRSGAQTLTLALDRTGRALLSAATRALRVEATATFSTPTGTVVQQRSLLLRLPPRRRRRRASASGR